MCGCVREADSEFSISSQKISPAFWHGKRMKMMTPAWLHSGGKEELVTHGHGEAEEERDDTKHHEHSRYEVEHYMLRSERIRAESQPQMSDVHQNLS